LPDATAEAIRIYRCLNRNESNRTTARAFGCSLNTVVNIINGKTHNGKPRGNLKGKRPGQISIVGRDKRQTILDILKSGHKDVNEIRDAIGSDPGAYLTEMRKAGKIERKFVWVLK